MGSPSLPKGFLDEDVLEYLEKCPTWRQLHKECSVAWSVEPNECISEAEGQLRVEHEFVEYIDAKSPSSA